MIISRAIFLCVLLWSGIGAVCAETHNETVPIVEYGTPVTTLSYEDLRAIFTLGITRWADGSRIVVILLSSDNVLQRQFLFEYFGLTPSRYEEIVSSRINSGRANPPIIVNTETEMIRKVGTTIGSIGFTSSRIYIDARDGVKVIPVL